MMVRRLWPKHVGF